MKAANDKNRYLQLRRNVWFLHWNVPKELREHHVDLHPELIHFSP